MLDQNYWKKCSNCKKEIGFLNKYWVCNVSTCNKKRTGLSFCSVACWDAHVPVMNHRESWAEERIAPTKQKFMAELQGESSQSTTTAVSNQPLQKEDHPTDWNTEVLVVASKIKSYIRESAGMSTSDRVMQVLSYQIRKWADAAINRAKASGRQTVMDRDIE